MLTVEGKRETTLLLKIRKIQLAIDLGLAFSEHQRVSLAISKNEKRSREQEFTSDRSDAAFLSWENLKVKP